jgi:hypothetical protein
MKPPLRRPRKAPPPVCAAGIRGGLDDGVVAAVPIIFTDRGHGKSKGPRHLSEAARRSHMLKLGEEPMHSPCAHFGGAVSRGVEAA